MGVRREEERRTEDTAQISSPGDCWKEGRGTHEIEDKPGDAFQTVLHICESMSIRFKEKPWAG